MTSRRRMENRPPSGDDEDATRGQLMRMGVETEFGIFGGWNLGKAKSIHAEVQKCPHLPAAIGYGGLFLANGARVYIDQEKQNEYCTPETESPSDLVVRELSGRRFMQKMAAQAGHSLLCSNYDYASRNTWGTHENYECPAALSAGSLMFFFTHLVTRIIYTGAGGLDPDFAGVRPVLSPRASSIVTPLAHQGRLAKALVYVKPNNYSNGHRLHVFCGESLLSHTADYLKYGTTALVTMLLNQGEYIGPGPFTKPIQRELKRLNRDTSLSARFELERGGRFTALEIQEWILADVVARQGKLPDWAPLVITRWETMLADLRAARPAASQTVDWLIYKDCLSQLAGEQGFDAEKNSVSNRQIAYRKTGRKTMLEIPLDLTALRNAACELYIRLHVLGEQSLFSAIGGEHQLSEITDERITDSVENPPPGRATTRAEFVRKYHGSGRFQVSWDMAFDTVINGTLEIPCEPIPEWEKAPFVLSDHPSTDLAQSREDDFRQGDYHKVIERFSRLNPAELDWRALDTYALSFARLGMRKQAQDVLSLLRPHCTQFHGVAEELFCTINFGLVPPLEEMKPLIEMGDAILLASTANHDLFVYQQNKARFLTLQGHYEEAKALFKKILERENGDVRPRMVSRTECYYAELLRLCGDAEGAQAYVSKAIIRQGNHQLIGDIAEHGLPLLAKIMPDRVAGSYLNQAVTTQKLFRNDLGYARLICLRARILGDGSFKEEFDSLRGQVPVLKTCPVAIRIAENWEEWIHPDQDVTPRNYWGL